MFLLKEGATVWVFKRQYVARNRWEVGTRKRRVEVRLNRVDHLGLKAKQKLLGWTKLETERSDHGTRSSRSSARVTSVASSMPPPTTFALSPQSSTPVPTTPPCAEQASYTAMPLS